MLMMLNRSDGTARRSFNSLFTVSQPYLSLVLVLGQHH